MRILLLLVGFLILFASEILRVYFIMPFPGSQEDETLNLAYFIHQNIWLLRIVGMAVVARPAWHYVTRGQLFAKSTVWILFGAWLVVIYLFNFRFLADKMFLQPETVAFESATANKKIKDSQLVIGVSIGTESKAYPIQIIGYHHQVRDVVGGKPIMVTYCTVCRTGRVYEPQVDGEAENFRLVGMDHYNAMFEDARTGSWWRQVSGEAVVGPLKGKSLTEVPSAQMSLAAWVRLHPETKILQPDSVFKQAYDDMADYDAGKRKGRLTRRDSLSWKDKSWVVGISSGLAARAYDWNDLTETKLIQDELDGKPLLLVLESDKASFHAYRRDSLSFTWDETSSTLIDQQTGSKWGLDGKCNEGKLAGAMLETMPAYQEYWHSWKTFRPNTDQFMPQKK